MNQEDQSKKLSQLIAKCWADEGFKQRLLKSPDATLTAEGVELPAGVSIKALENTDKVFHLVIPPKPTGDLSDEDLDKVSGGLFCGSCFCRTSSPAKKESEPSGGQNDPAQMFQQILQQLTQGQS